MNLVLVNPPHSAIGSRVPREHLPPLGLLWIGGPLIDAGHNVRLLDAEFGPMSIQAIVDDIAQSPVDAVLLGHSGSSSAHPVVVEITRALRSRLPDVKIIYGGVYPSYHWCDILPRQPQIDFIVRGEGEVIATELVNALANGTPLDHVKGIAFLRDGKPHTTPMPIPIQDLDAQRIGWEIIDFARYSYWGDKRAVVVQFSRGCPHLCTYCGQRLFWRRWRHRDPRRFAAELAWLHREHGVEMVNFADETPTEDRDAWKAFLEALIAENVNLILVGSTRTDDIVRDADILHLYKEAGAERFLLGIESYNENTLRQIRKGSDLSTDRKAIELLRQHDILSMATYAVGFARESHRDYWHALRHLLRYDPDQIQLLYATPHHWTPFFRDVRDQRIIQPDQTKWDYKHQVLANESMPPWMVLCWVKLIEVIMQMRPRALRRLLTHRDKSIRAAIRWYYRIGRKVWFREIAHFFLRDAHLKDGPTVEEFWTGTRSTATTAAPARPVYTLPQEE